MSIINGQPADADEVMNLSGNIFRNFTAVLWNTSYNEGGDYSSWNAKLHSDGSPQFKNLLTNTFQTNSAYAISNLIYDNTNKYYHCLDLSSAYLVYMDIYATSVTTATLTDSGNNLYCVQLDTGVWRVYSWNGSINEAFNRLITKMFDGLADGATNPNGVTGLTDLRCSESTYRDMKLFYLYGNYSATLSAEYLQAALSGTGTSYVISDYLTATGSAPHKYLKSPVATIIHNITDTPINHRNTSTIHTVSSCDGIRFDYDAGSYTATISSVLIYPSSLSATETTSGGLTTKMSTEFLINSAAPDIATYPIENSYLIVQDTTATVTNSITCWGTNIDNSTIVTKNNSADGTNYIAITDGQIARYTNTGTDFRRKITLVRTDLTKIDKITEEATIYNWY